MRNRKDFLDLIFPDLFHGRSSGIENGLKEGVIRMDNNGHFASMLPPEILKREAP